MSVSTREPSPNVMTMHSPPPSSSRRWPDETVSGSLAKVDGYVETPNAEQKAQA